MRQWIVGADGSWIWSENAPRGGGPLNSVMSGNGMALPLATDTPASTLQVRAVDFVDGVQYDLAYCKVGGWDPTARRPVEWRFSHRTPVAMTTDEPRGRFEFDVELTPMAHALIAYIDKAIRAVLQERDKK